MVETPDHQLGVQTSLEERSSFGQDMSTNYSTCTGLNPESDGFVLT